MHMSLYSIMMVFFKPFTYSSSINRWLFASASALGTGEYSLCGIKPRQTAWAPSYCWTAESKVWNTLQKHLCQQNVCCPGGKETTKELLPDSSEWVSSPAVCWRWLQSSSLLWKRFPCLGIWKLLGRLCCNAICSTDFCISKYRRLNLELQMYAVYKLKH